MLGQYNDYNIEEKDDERTRFEFPYQEEEKLTSVDYWESALKVINCWGQYLGKKKLYINATHPETVHSVQKVVDDNFEGSLKKLKDRENETSKEVDDALVAFEAMCWLFKVEKVSRKWLFDNLKDGKDTQKLRGKINRKIKSGKTTESIKNLI